jgi:sulfur-oxidizing protein SoxY
MAAINRPSFGRREFLRAAAAAGIAATLSDLVPSATAQTTGVGMPLPDELIEATLKRLFGNRTFQRGDDMIKLELPLIAEDGGNVTITVDSTLPVSGAVAVSSIFIISEKNRRPMLVKFSFTPECGRAFVSTAIRLATTTDVRAVVEMNDGTLYAVSKHVRVTISGCDMPAQS